MSKRKIISVGFMLFAMFFGAGNLIFPIALGMESGEYFWPAIIGFVLTGVGLPLIGVIGGGFSKGGYRESLKKIHPTFSTIFLIVIYLTIGPFFAIPRTATTSYELGLLPFLDGQGFWSLFLFSAVFFAITLYLSLKPGDLVDTIGNILTPTLLITIIALIVRAIFMYFTNDPSTAAGSFVEQNAFSIGFTEGYLTMDAIAAIAFSIIVVKSIQSMGVTNQKELFAGTARAALIAAILLGTIFISLGWIGNHVNIGAANPNNQNLGTFLLTFVAGDTFGGFGVILLGAIVFLACLTTSTGLITSVSEYFNSLFPKVSYKSFAILFTLISFAIANVGLNTVIAASTPVLNIIYPIAMTSVFLLFLTNVVPSPRLSLQLPVGIVTIVSFLATFHRSGWLTMGWLEYLPFFNATFEWVPLMIIGYLVGYLIALKQPKMVFQ